MKKLGRQMLLTKSRRKCAPVCASLLVVVVGALLLLGSFTSISSVSPLFHGGNLFKRDLIKQIRTQENLYTRVQAIEMKEAQIAALEDTSAQAQFDPRSAVEGNLDNDRLSSSRKDAGSLGKRCTKSRALLKVFMYDLPPELHFGMIEPMNVKEGHTWPSNLTNIVGYPGGLNQQHSPEYWLTLDLLNNSEEDVGLAHTRRPCAAIRVKDARDADVYFVPFFASLCYNKFTRLGMREKDIELQKKVVDFVVMQEPWKRSNGRDHVIVMHHPNSLLMARTLLHGATFVVADFGRFSSKVAHFGKDVVAPYKHIIPSFNDDHSSFHSRPTLLFFQGAIERKEGGSIRKKLYSLIKNEKGVVFKVGIFGHEGIKTATKGMRSSKFCLHLAGDTPSSNRLFDAIASHCVPVIISKDIELPYENVLDYSKFCLFVNSSHALKKGFLIDLLRSIQRDEWTRMWKRLIKVQAHFEYQFPSQADDAVQMVWKSIAYKVPTIKQGLHKDNRYSSSNTFKKLLSLKSNAYKEPIVKQGLHKSNKYSRSNRFKKLSCL